MSIISASRRTDIPSYYSEWFLNRIKAGYLYVRNPMNPHRISEISLSPDVVDGIVFWTKNPIPMMGRFEELRDYPYYFQFTLNPYGPDIEGNLPSKQKVLVPAFQALSSAIGKERVVWRYDPILLNERYTPEYHIRSFGMLAEQLADYTETCTISFIDLYKNIRRRIEPLEISAPSEAQIQEVMGRFGEIAVQYGLELATCAEEMDLSRFGIRHASCIDVCRLERIGNCKLDIPKDKNQRLACGCSVSVDIGAYHTCLNGCVYCYANFSKTLVERCHSGHDPQSPLLCGAISSEDSITPKEMKSSKATQIKLF